jgi:SAM-dependent methyltransferase
MSGFASEWLALREPLDLAVRNRDVESAFLKTFTAEGARILDLASGAGSTVAGLRKYIQEPAEWQLTDYDPSLLEIASTRWQASAEYKIKTRQIDLEKNLEQLSLSDVDAITTSAFLDLVSDSFLRRLVNFVVQADKPFLASLTYDGQASFEPAHPMDRDLGEALNRHQQTDKGFGSALGPDAAQRAIKLFKAAGYEVVWGKSDWKIEGSQSDFLQEFLGGWMRVGREVGLEDSALEAWWQDRIQRIHSGELSMTVGHIDFVAHPRANTLS